MPEVSRILKDGYWDTTSVIRGPDGDWRVRKESKRTDTPGPWAHEALRKEVACLSSLPRSAQRYFPPLLDAWDDETIGYEIPYYANRRDVAQLVLENSLTQDDCDEIQSQLAAAVLHGLHGVERESGTSFARHLESILEESLQALSQVTRFRPLVEEPRVTINGRSVPGLRRSLARVREAGLFDRLAREPSVRLHGDLILENLLWRPLLLIDPVSVAGIDRGPPLFDLVKYESYATGELYAIREELVAAGPSGSGYAFEIPPEHPRLAPFRRLDLVTVFRAAHQRRHGPVDARLHNLLDAYFSLVMARNTTGTHQWARLLKAALALH